MQRSHHKQKSKNHRKSRVQIPLVSSLISRIRRERPTLLSLEDSVLNNIHQRLSLVDGACLSLSCKRFYGLFGATLKQKEFNFPRLLQIRIPILCVNSTNVPRNQLLLRLENRRWNYCGKCLKLHPRKEFPRASLQYPARGRSCTKYSGIVDICPCAALTIRERGRIVKLLKSPTPTALSQAQIGPFKFGHTGGPHLSHSCSLVDTPNNNARVEMRIYINKSDHLVIHARYTMGFSTLPAIFCCPHENLISSTYLNLDNQICAQCWTSIYRNRISQGLESAVFDVKRDLGSCEWPADSRWLSNCRLTGDEFSQDLKLWSSPQLTKKMKDNYSEWSREYREDQLLQQEEYYARIRRHQERSYSEAYQSTPYDSPALDMLMFNNSILDTCVCSDTSCLW